MAMTLNMCVICTFDLDLNTLDSMIPVNGDVSRYTVFYGEGLFRDPEGLCPREADLRKSIVKCCLYSHRLGMSAEDSLVRIHDTPPESRRDGVLHDDGPAVMSGNLKFSLWYRHLRNMGYRSLVSQYYGYQENRQMKRM